LKSATENLPKHGDKIECFARAFSTSPKKRRFIDHQSVVKTNGAYGGFNA